MSVDPACPQRLPGSEPLDSMGFPPPPVSGGQEEQDLALPMTSAEVPHTETVSSLPSSVDPLIRESPDSSTSPRVDKSSVKKEEKVQVKKQKSRTVFSATQLCVLNARFQRQKYLSLQQMQELSDILNLSYKQVKTWFQNQRMKCKQWQKNKWPKNCSGVTQKGPAPAEYPGIYAAYHQGCPVNPSGNFPGWNLTWNTQSWNTQAWSTQSWSTQSWNSQTWCSPAWDTPFYNCGEESLQSSMQFQQVLPAGDLEAILETSGEGQNVIQQTAKYLSTAQTMDFMLNYSMSMLPEDA